MKSRWVAAAATFTLLATPAPASAAPVVTSPQAVCGGGYRVQRSHVLPGAVVYQLYNGSTTCVTTIKTANVGTPTKITAGLQVRGGSWAYDTGAFKSYAGPEKQPSRGKCVRYFGYSKGRSYTSTWANCD
jgi:eukaryotic-like serine/threonine-protein kinase